MAKRKLLKIQDRHALFDIPTDEDSLIRRYGVTTRKWRICPTFKNVSGIQVGLTVDVVAFSALRAS